MLKSNFKSAAGSDKLSNNFIKTFWNIIRQPLYDVSKSGLENNNLPDTFMTADIKLIPKKGDLTQIKNWRLISLLSNLYKIVSRAINIRLKKIAPRILSRAQKGFCPNKYMHEVIINSIERINYCNDNYISGVMISADLSKAFDSVSHEFMEKCYDFYRFGPRIKRWLKSIGTGRTARILLGSGGEATEIFNLEKGHAQGDSPSPLLFNFAQQIMLFKLELDPDILRIRPFAPLPASEPPQKFAESECNCETDKCDGFADDNYTFTLSNEASIRKIFVFLAQFEILTGLKCNISKTNIMQLGPVDNEIVRKLSDLNLSWTDEIKMLGFTILNNWDLIMEKNLTNLNKKIINIINYWKRYGLSMIGRITVYKSLILPHINFICSILTPPVGWFENMESFL
jgi:Reverse transcriptase (RNA-dependent DNA polymerase)